MTQPDRDRSEQKCLACGHLLHSTEWCGVDVVTGSSSIEMCGCPPYATRPPADSEPTRTFRTQGDWTTEEGRGPERIAQPADSEGSAEPTTAAGRRFLVESLRGDPSKWADTPSKLMDRIAAIEAEARAASPALEHAIELAEQYHSGHSVAGAPCRCDQCRELEVVRRYARAALAAAAPPAGGLDSHSGPSHNFIDCRRCNGEQARLASRDQEEGEG